MNLVKAAYGGFPIHSGVGRNINIRERGLDYKLGPQARCREIDADGSTGSTAKPFQFSDKLYPLLKPERVTELKALGGVARVVFVEDRYMSISWCPDRLKNIGLEVMLSAGVRKKERTDLYHSNGADIIIVDYDLSDDAQFPGATPRD